MGGFPLWTVYGMVVSLIAAIALLMFSFRMQNPLRRARATTYEIERRIRTLTTLALALLFLTVGFFIAGVPFGIGGQDGGESVVEATSTPLPTLAANVPPSVTPESGSFGAPIRVTNTPNTVIQQPTNVPIVQPIPVATEVSEVAEVADSGEEVPAVPTPTLTPVPPTNTPNPSDTPTLIPTETPTPTPTNTPTPTQSPTPTITPTPIEKPTARVNTGGSTLWLRDAPSGDNLALLQYRDIVIVLPGNASHSGRIWKNVMTPDGTEGWVESRWLGFGADE